MGAVVRGRRFGEPCYVDNVQGASGFLNIQPLASGISGAIYDLLAILPQGTHREQNGHYPNQLGLQVRITNASGTDGYNLDVRVKYSHDSIDWADRYEGDAVGSYTDANLSADMIWSNESIVVPQNRYMVLEYDNNNNTDPVTVASRFFPKW